jgi:type VII secretion protein EccB
VAGDDFFVVLADGVQRIGETAANLIRSLDSQGSREIPSVSPDAVAGVPAVDSLPVLTYPERVSVPLGARDGGALCAGWQPDGPKTAVWIADSRSDTMNSVELAQSDGDGANVDSVVMPVGRSAYVRAASLGRQRDESGPLYLVTDTGVLFGIRDEETAKMLGVEGDPVAAPWPLLARLPRGPELSRDAALVARDGIASPS